jgi:hypothetical protein
LNRQRLNWRRIFVCFAVVASVADALVLWFGYLFKWYTLTGNNEAGLTAVACVLIVVGIWIGFLFNWDTENLRSAKYGDVGPVATRAAPVKHRGQGRKGSMFTR